MTELDVAPPISFDITIAVPTPISVTLIPGEEWALEVAPALSFDIDVAPGPAAAVTPVPGAPVALVATPGQRGQTGPEGPSGANAPIAGEVPTGTKDGVNEIFTLVWPFVLGTTAVFRNGIRELRGTGYLETAPNQITFTTAPLVDDELVVDYLIQAT